MRLNYARKNGACAAANTSHVFHRPPPPILFIYQLEIFFVLNFYFFLQLYLCKNYETLNGAAELYIKWGNIELAWAISYTETTPVWWWTGDDMLYMPRAISKSHTRQKVITEDVEETKRKYLI